MASHWNRTSIFTQLRQTVWNSSVALRKSLSKLSHWWNIPANRSYSIWKRISCFWPAVTINMWSTVVCRAWAPLSTKSQRIIDWFAIVLWGKCTDFFHTFQSITQNLIISPRFPTDFTNSSSIVNSNWRRIQTIRSWIFIGHNSGAGCSQSVW